jgi:hypothetical protein
MNTAMTFYPADRPLAKGARVAAVSNGSFTASRFSADRLKAFATRFSPSNDSWMERAGGVALTLGAYVGVAAAAYGLSTVNVIQVLHALHLNGV